MPTTVHLKRDPDCYRVDRATALGNPFDLASEAQRTAVIRAHKEYLWLVVSRGFEPVAAAEKLGCWCAPKPCHADNYVALFEYWELAAK
jgi:Domain of unknown function (DUF4326)